MITCDLTHGGPVPQTPLDFTQLEKGRQLNLKSYLLCKKTESRPLDNHVKNEQ